MEIYFFNIFLQQKTHRKKTDVNSENGFFYTGFSCSWFWKSPNLQNHKHRCRWPMSLLQNHKHSIWTEKKLGLWMSFGFFWISLGLLDGHNKYQELGNQPFGVFIYVLSNKGIPYTPNNRPTVSGLFFCFLTLISDILNFPSKINSWRFWNGSLGRNEHKKNWNPRSTIKSLVRGFWKGRLEKKTRSQGFQDAPSELPFGMFVIFRTLWKERNTVTVEHSGTL